MKYIEKILPPLWVILVVFSAVMTISSFRTDPLETDEVVTGSKKQSIAYNYLVYPLPSVLYPQGTEPLPPGRPSYFAALTERVDFEVTAEITGVSAGLQESDLAIRLFIRSEGQWLKELNLPAEVTATEEAGGVTRFHTVFTLPFREATELAERIIEETNVRPRESYMLTVQSTLSCPPLKPGDAGDFISEYEFSLSRNLLEPKGELFLEKTETTTEEITTVNHLNLAGYPIKVSTGRILFPSLLVLFLAGAVAYFFNLKKKRLTVLSRGEAELKTIKRKHGGRIIEVRGAGDIPDTYLKVEMESFKDLVKVADERERPIFQANAGKTDTVQFYLVDDNTVYLHRLSVG